MLLGDPWVQPHGPAKAQAADDDNKGATLSRSAQSLAQGCVLEDMLGSRVVVCTPRAHRQKARKADLSINKLTPDCTRSVS